MSRPALALTLALGACAAPDDTVVRLHVLTAPTLSVDGLAIAIGDERHHAMMTTDLELRVPESWQGLPLPIVVDGTAAGAIVATGSTFATPVAGGAVDATVGLFAAGCDPICALDATACDGDGVIRCGFGSDGCPAWGAALACPADAPSCSDGVCDLTCHDECAADATRCEGDDAARACGQYDGDACLDWGPASACGEGQACADDVCGDDGGGGGDACRPSACTPETLVLDATGIIDLRLTAERVYWSVDSGQRVMTWPKAGGPVETLASDQYQARDLAVDASHVYWAGYPAKAVVRRALAGGLPEVLHQAEASSVALGLDASHVYWGSEQDSFPPPGGVPGTIKRRAKAGGAVETFAGGLPEGPYGLEVDDGHVYWTSFQGAAIKRRPKDGGAIEAFAAEQGNPRALHLDATHACWAAGADRVVCRPKAGGALEVVASDQDGPTGVATTADDVYWSDGRGIWRRARAGGRVEPVVATAARAHGVAVDDVHVYWFEAGGALRRAPRCGCTR